MGRVKLSGFLSLLLISETSFSILAEQLSLLPLIDAMFVEANPAPIKYAMSRLGLCREDMRLPMAAVGEATRAIIDRAMSQA